MLLTIITTTTTTNATAAATATATFQTHTHTHTHTHTQHARPRKCALTRVLARLPLLETRAQDPDSTQAVLVGWCLQGTAY